MNEKEFANPYLAPLSNLTDDSEDGGAWNEYSTSLGEKYARSYWFGSTLAIYCCVVGTFALDCFLHGWIAIAYAGMPTFLTLFLAFFVTFACTIPMSKIYIRYKKRTTTLTGFIATQRRNSLKWYSSPLVLTTITVIGSAALWIYAQVLFGFLGFVDLSMLAKRSRALFAVPLAMPVVLAISIVTRRKAIKLIEQMSSRI